MSGCPHDDVVDHRQREQRDYADRHRPHQMADAIAVICQLCQHHANVPSSSPRKRMAVWLEMSRRWDDDSHVCCSRSSTGDVAFMSNGKSVPSITCRDPTVWIRNSDERT